MVASFPGPSRGGGGRAGYTLHVLGDPRKMWGNRILSYTLRLSPIELYVMQNLRMITMVTRPVAMEIPAHVRGVYQALSPPLEGPGNEAIIVEERDYGNAVKLQSDWCRCRNNSVYSKSPDPLPLRKGLAPRD